MFGNDDKYMLGAANGQYRSMGAEGCIKLTQEKGYTQEEVEEIWQKGEEEEAIVYDGETPCLVVEYPGRHQEVYSKRALTSDLTRPQQT